MSYCSSNVIDSSGRLRLSIETIALHVDAGKFNIRVAGNSRHWVNIDACEELSNIPIIIDRKDEIQKLLALAVITAKKEVLEKKRERKNDTKAFKDANAQILRATKKEKARKDKPRQKARPVRRDEPIDEAPNYEVEADVEVKKEEEPVDYEAEAEAKDEEAFRRALQDANMGELQGFALIEAYITWENFKNCGKVKQEVYVPQIKQEVQPQVKQEPHEDLDDVCDLFQAFAVRDVKIEEEYKDAPRQH